MQKKLIALAVAGLVSAPVFAQSNVTIYGLVDVGVASRSDNIASGVGNKTSVDSGIANGNRIGFKGTEDLGNGLKAGFVLEKGLYVDQGTGRGDGEFSRQAFLTFGGNFGTFAVGRQYTPQDVFLGSIDPFGNGMVGQYSNIYAEDARTNNTIAYASPSFSGLTIKAAYSNATGNNGSSRQSPATSGNVSGATNENIENDDDVRYFAIQPTYANGPLTVGLNLSRTRAQTSGADPIRIADVAGSYDFGVVKLAAMFGTRKQSDVNDIRQWMVGATVPVSASGNILASYTRGKDKELDDGQASQWAVGYTHALSKRTGLYAVYADINNDDDTGKSVADSSNGGEGYQRGFQLGVRHSF